MEAPVFTKHARSARAYVPTGECIEIHETEKQDWATIEVYPAWYERQPSSAEEPITQAEFAAVYHRALTTLQQAGHLLGLNTAPVQVTLVEATPTPLGVEGVDYPDMLGHYNHEYNSAPAMSEAEKDLLPMSEEQRQAIRTYYQGQVPREVALRFDFRRSDGFTRATAREFLQQLTDGKEQAA